VVSVHLPAYLKLRVSKKFRAAKEEWCKNPDHHGSEEIPPPPANKSCLDRARNSIAQTAAQVEGRGGGDPGGKVQELICYFSLFFTFLRFCNGDSYPEMCAQRNYEGGGSLMLWSSAGAETGFLCLPFFSMLSTYLFEIKD
jgi:hypothetical protein